MTLTQDEDLTFAAPVLRPAGDMGVLVEFGEIYHPVINRAVLAFDSALTEILPKGVIETVPTFRSVLVRFDPFELPFDRLEALLSHLLASRDWFQSDQHQNQRSWLLPVVYGGENGPDLAEVAGLMQMSEAQVVESHCAQPLVVAMLGFSPGLAYLGQLPPIWDFARRSTINPKVPAGAILVAVRQTVLPSTAIPTGWRQIGRTPFRGFDPAARTPFVLSPGDEVRFHPVSQSDYDAFDMAAVLREAGL